MKSLKSLFLGKLQLDKTILAKSFLPTDKNLIKKKSYDFGIFEYSYEFDANGKPIKFYSTYGGKTYTNYNTWSCN